MSEIDPREIGAIIRAAREAKGLSQEDLGRAIGMKQQSLDSVEKGKTQRSRFLPEIASELGIKPETVGLPKDGPVEPANGFVEGVIGARDFPIYSAVEGGPGEIIRSSDPMDWLPRPAPVAHVKEAYGLYVIGESMSPEFEPADIALINPRLPPMPGKPCIFYAEIDGEARATIKRFLRASPTQWHVYQHNPPHGSTKEFTLPRKEWTVCHRVLGKYYPQ